jgi:hypothetical protein
MFVINNAGRKRLTPTCDISFEALSLSSRNCAAITPADIVNNTAIEACRAPKKGTRKDWASSDPMAMVLLIERAARYEMCKMGWTGVHRTEGNRFCLAWSLIFACFEMGVGDLRSEPFAFPLTQLFSRLRRDEDKAWY